jgi:hypothetical protein
MLKWLNILAIAYLAIAPGMDVGRLIHSVNLCRFADPAGHTTTVAQADAHCGHNHKPTKPEPQEEECPHLHSVTVHTAAMPVAQLQPVEGAALPTLNPPVLEMQAPFSACHVSDDDPRPPPGPMLVGIVVLLV